MKIREIVNFSIWDFKEQRFKYPISGGEKLFLYLAGVVGLVMLAVALLVGLPIAWGDRQATVNLIPLIFGTTAGFAGAWAVVILAGQALDIQNRATKQDDPEYILAVDCLKGIEQLRASLAGLLATWRLDNQLKCEESKNCFAFGLTTCCEDIKRSAMDIPMSVVLASSARYIDSTKKPEDRDDLEIEFIQLKSNLLEAAERFLHSEVIRSGEIAVSSEIRSEIDEEDRNARFIRRQFSARLMRLMACSDRFGAFLNKLIKEISNISVPRDSEKPDRRCIYFQEFSKNVPAFNISSECKSFLKDSKIIIGEKKFDEKLLKRIIDNYFQHDLENESAVSSKNKTGKEGKLKYPIICFTAEAGEIKHIEKARNFACSTFEGSQNRICLTKTLEFYDPSKEEIKTLSSIENICRRKLLYFPGKPRFLTEELLAKFISGCKQETFMKENLEYDLTNANLYGDIEALHNLKEKKSKFLKEIKTKKQPLINSMSDLIQAPNTVVIFDNVDKWDLPQSPDISYLKCLVEESIRVETAEKPTFFEGGALLIFCRSESWVNEELLDEMKDESDSLARSQAFSRLFDYAFRIGYAAEISG